MRPTEALIQASLLIGGLVFILWVSFVIRDELREFMFDDRAHIAWKVLCVVPYVVIWVWCWLLQVIFVLLTVGLAISLANDFKKWWRG